MKESCRIYESAMQYTTVCYDFIMLGYAVQNCAWNRIFHGDNLATLLTWLEKNMQNLRQKFKLSITDVMVITYSLYECYYWLVESKQPTNIDPGITDSVIEGATDFTQWTVNFHKMCVYYFLESKEAYNLLPKIEEGMPYYLGVTMWYDFWFYSPLIRIRYNLEDPKLLEHLDECIDKLSSYAKLQKAFKPRLLILQAERLALTEPENLQVMRYFEEAKELGESIDAFHIAGIAAERCYEFLVRNNVTMGQRGCLDDAYEMYHKWGAQCKCRRIQKGNSGSDTDSSSMSNSWTTESDVSVHNMVLTQVTKLLSNEDRTSECIEVFCKVTMQYAGADRGCLFYKFEEKLYVLAIWGSDIGTNIYSLPTSNSKPVLPASNVEEQFPLKLIEDTINGDKGEDAISVSGFGNSVCIVPMKYKDSIIGAVFLENTLLQGAFPIQHQGILRHLACQTVAIISRNETNKSLKRSLKKVEKRASMLESLNRMKDDFVASTSHELRTPLNAILGFGEILKETDLTDEQYEYCEMILASGEGLLSVINDILDFQRCQKDNLTITTSSFDLRKCFDHVLRLLVIKTEEVELLLHLDPSFPSELWTACDKLRLQQILLNLVSNAIKFTSTGYVCLSVTIEHNTEILSRVLERESTSSTVALLIQVEDTGIGIPPDKMSKLFQPFSQVDSGPTRQYTGTGLGLTISQKLVHMLSKGKSKIKCESKQNIGSKFYFHLPVELLPASAARKDEVSRRETSIQLLDGNIFVIFIPSEKVREFFLYEIRVVETFMKRFCNSLASVIQTVKELRQSYPSKQILCYLDIGATFNPEDIKPFIKTVHKDHPLLFLITRMSQRNEYHTLLSAEKYPVTIITKPFYKDLILNCSAARVQNTVASPSPTLEQQQQKVERKTSLDSFLESGESKNRILMVEDNTMNQRVQSRMLKLLGYECDIAVNGKEGVQKYKDRISIGIPYDIILMDFHMPVMDGKEATRLIREYEKQNDIPHTHIIGLTADIHSTKLSMCDILSKPIKKEPFYKKVMEYLNLTVDCSTIQETESKVDEVNI